MCELFGYSGNTEEGLAEWLLPFRDRGGGTGDNPDGWGVASWHATDLELVKSPEPGYASGRFAHLAAGLRAKLVVAHVRKARIPPVPGMLNTHPFAHDCCDRRWVFAHNGLVPEVIAWQPAGMLCHPAGETDSEHAFCHLLTAIAGSYDDAGSVWISHLAELSGKIAALGKFNFLLSDGQVLIAYGHDRLHHLAIADDAGRRAIVATEAVTPHAWRPFAPGELRVYRDGALLATAGAAHAVSG
jgi:predicted glutamine amidotransferase